MEQLQEEETVASRLSNFASEKIMFMINILQSSAFLLIKQIFISSICLVIGFQHEVCHDFL